MTDHNQHPKSDGALFVNNDKTAENHPDFRGHVIVTPAQIRRLQEMMAAGVIETDRNGNKLGMKLQVVAWKKVSKAGAPYLFVNTEAYMKPVQGAGWDGPPQGQQPPAQQQGGWGPPAPAPQQPAPQQPADWGTPPTGFRDLESDDVPF